MSLIILLSFCLIGVVSAEEISELDSNDNAVFAIDSEVENTLEPEDAINYQSNEQSLDNNQDVLTATGDTIYVSTKGSDANGDGTKTKPYQSLKYAVETSSNGSTIYVASGKYAGEKNRNINIEKDLTLIGNSSSNTIIDGEKLGRILVADNSRLTLIGLTFINGFFDGDQSINGGAISANKGELTLINCTVKDSYGNRYGGAIYNYLGTLTIDNCNFVNNSAYNYGGAIYTAGSITIENSNINYSNVTGGKFNAAGGGIAIMGGTGNLKNCTFLKNYSSWCIAAVLNYGTTTIDNCTFLNGTTPYGGGGVSNHNYLLINNSYFGYADVEFYGGAIIAPNSGHHTLTEAYNTIFENNNARYHAAVSNSYEDCEIIVEKCAVVGNYIDKYRLYGDFTIDENASLQYNWWGQNEISPYYLCGDNTGDVNASKWLVMSFTSSNGIIYQEKENILTVDLKHYFDNDTKEIYEYNEDLNLPLNVKFFTEDGKVIGNVRLVNGTATLNYNPNSNVGAVYAQLNNQTLKIDVEPKTDTKITVSEFSKYVNTNKQLEFKLLDGNNSALANKEINITVGGVQYTKITDENGSIALDINLSAGDYNTIVKYAGDDVYRSLNKNIKIHVLKNKTSFVASNLVKYYKNGTSLSVKLLDNNKKALKNKTVKIKIAGKTYSKTTNSKGIATFAINQKVGTYSVKISFNGDKIYNATSKTIKVYVKSAKLTTKTKKIHRNKYFVATLKDKNGKAIKKTKVKIKLNGKTYTRTTNNKGVVKLKVSVKIGTYKIKTSFKSTKLYGATVFTNKIKVIK